MAKSYEQAKDKIEQEYSIYIAIKENTRNKRKGNAKQWKKLK